MGVSEILAENWEHRTDGNTVSEMELSNLEDALNTRLVEDHRKFLLMGGLDDLRFSQNFLTPDEIVEARAHVGSLLVPFADDGTGDVFCWSPTDDGCHEILRWNHESGETEHYCESFVECLKKWRF